MKRVNKTKSNKSYLIIGIILLVIILVCSINMFSGTYSLNNVNEYISISDDRVKDEELNRFTYEEGFYYEDLSSSIKNRITGYTFPDNTYEKITYDDLKYLRVKYYDFDNNLHDDGELIVNKEVALEVLKIFYELYLEKYQIAKIKLADDYSADDDLSMKDNNTSSFNFRNVENSKKLSWHCFGLAIDINPLYNPYVVGGKVYPSTAKKYSNRSKKFAGKIDHDDYAYKVFTKYGWKWGGDFIYSKDYQHFYKEIYDDSVRDVK